MSRTVAEVSFGFLVRLSIGLVMMIAGALRPSAFGQGMYQQTTVYTDYSISGSSYHAWGYTYSPSGSATVHTYSVTTTITFPSGNSQGSSYGSGFDPAQVDVYRSITSNDLQNDRDGNISTSSQHGAACPFIGTYLAVVTWPVPNTLAIKITTTNTTGGYQDVAGERYCNTTPACWNTSTPACGAGGVTIGTSTSNTCGYWKTGFFATPIYGGGYDCSKGLSIPWFGVGYCSPS